MNESFTAGFLLKLAETEAQWSRAKAHLAKGHESEKKRLQALGLGTGMLAGMPLAGYDYVQAALGKKKPRALALLAPVIGAGLGHLLGERAALKRLELSQTRDPAHGQYVPYAHKVANILRDSAAVARGSLWQTKRMTGTLKPPKHKPIVVKTPQPAPPQVEPSTFTPTQNSMTTQAKTSSCKKHERGKKLRARLGGGEPMTWKGSKGKEYEKGPENKPVPESWRGHDF